MTGGARRGARLGADLRLVPAALGAWLAAGIAIGVRDAGGAVPIVAAVLGAISIALVVGVVLRLGEPVAGASGVRRRGRAAASSIAVVLAAGAAVCAAVAAGQAAREPPEIAAIPSGRTVQLDVAITGRPVEGRVPGTLLSAELGERVLAVSSPILVFGEPDDPGIADARIGEVLRVSASLTRADAGDDVAFLAFARDEAELIGSPPPLIEAADGIRAGFVRIAADLPGEGGGLLPGLAIGDTSAVSPSLDADMKASSLTHLTAVSGANCAVVVGLVFLAAAGLGASRTVRVVAAAVALVGFVVLVTPEASVVRAAVMAAVALLAVALGRPSRGIPLLSVAVIGLLVVDPWLARSYGFALSVLATGGLLLLAAPLAAILSRVLPRAPAIVLAVPISAQLACQPVLLLLDPSLPLFGVVANLLAEPAAPIATMLGLIACLLAPALPAVATAVAWLAWVPASWIAAVATFTAALPGARSPWPTGPLGVVLLVLLTIAGLVAALGWGPPRIRRLARAVVAVALVAYLSTLAGTRIVTELGRPSDWQFALCDVGQGDATVIRSAGVVALVDTGPDPALLRACLGELGIDRIDLLILTHYDLDHVGGVDAVVGIVDRALIGPPAIAPDGEPDSGDVAVDAALVAGGARVEQVSRGQRGVLGELRWEVLWPPARGVEPGNPASLVLAVEGGGGCRTTCLSGILLGDLGEESQIRLAGAARLAGVDVVKVSHHGSADQSAELYERLRATVGLIGVGADNDYGHPTDELLGVLAAVGTRPYRTDTDGLVLVSPGDDAGSLEVWTASGP